MQFTGLIGRYLESNIASAFIIIFKIGKRGHQSYALQRKAIAQLGSNNNVDGVNVCHKLPLIMFWS